MSIIGKNPNLSVNGIRPARTLLPKYKQVIGDCSSLFNVTLPFSKLTFARASDEYLLYNGVLTKQVTANEPATRVIGGRVFMQSEPALTTLNTYSEQIETYSSLNVSVDDNTENDPIGNLTLDKIEENVITVNSFYVYQTAAVTIGDDCSVIAVVKPSERNIAIQIDRGAAYYGQLFDLSTGEAISCSLYTGHEMDWSCILPLTGGLYLIAASVQMPSTGNASFYLRLFSGTSASYTGIIGYGVHAGFFNAYKKGHLASYVYAAAAPGTKAKCNGYYTEADVPAWMRNRFYFELITNHYDSAILAADGGEKHLWSFDPTAGGVAVRCYLDGADNKIKVDLEGTGNIITSAALTPTLDGRIRCWFTFDNGSNSVLKIDGAGVDEEKTGTQLSAANGNLYWGQREDATLQPSLLISEPGHF